MSVILCEKLIICDLICRVSFIGHEWLW